MMQMQAAIPLKSQNNGEEEAHAIGERAKETTGSAGGEQRFRATPKSTMDKYVEKFQLPTLKSLNERLLKEKHEKRKEFGALVQAKEGLELDLKKNADQKKQSQMDEMGDRICRLVGSERVKNVEIVRLKDENNGLVLKVEEEREKWMKVCCKRDGIKADFDGWLEELGDLRRKMDERRRMRKGLWKRWKIWR